MPTDMPEFGMSGGESDNLSQRGLRRSSHCPHFGATPLHIVTGPPGGYIVLLIRESGMRVRNTVCRALACNGG